MWELDYKESWALKNWCFWTVVLEKTLESPLNCQEIQPVHPKGNQSWIFIGRTDAEAETPILWPPDAKSWLIGKNPDAGKHWRQEEKGMTEDEMVEWHHWLNEHELEQAPGVGDGWGSLACCSPWGRKESDMTEQLKWTEYSSTHTHTHTHTHTTSSLFICWWTIRLFPCHGYLVPLWTQGCIYHFELQFCLDVCPEVGLLDHMTAILSVFWGSSILFSIVAALIYILYNTEGGFPFLHTLSNICYL